MKKMPEVEGHARMLLRGRECHMLNIHHNKVVGMSVRRKLEKVESAREDLLAHEIQRWICLMYTRPRSICYSQCLPREGEKKQRQS